MPRQAPLTETPGRRGRPTAALACAALLGLLLTVPTSYAAAPPAGAPAAAKPAAATLEELAAKGRALYDAGKFQEAVGAYVRAHQLGADARLLYNIAFIYDKKLAEIDLAMAYYRRYVQAADAEPPLVTKSLERLRVLKAAKDRAELDEIRKGDGTKAGTKAGIGTDPAQKRPGEAETTVDRTAGWVTLGSGVALLAGGVTFQVLASETHDDYKATTNYTRKRDLLDTSKTQALVGDILLGAGAVTIGVSVVLLLTARAEPSAERVNVGATA